MKQLTETFPPFVTHAALQPVRHGFFGREGGVSQNSFASLNCGPSSGDEVDAVLENQKRLCGAIGAAPEKLVYCKQIHSAKVVEVKTPWAWQDRPEADGLVTKEKGITLGVLTADCAPVLFMDNKAGVIGAAHAGWKGALAGVLEETIAAMQRLGSARKNIIVVIGPCIQQNSYEVGAEFKDAFLKQAAENDVFFRLSSKQGHFLFDLPAYALARLRTAGIAEAHSLGLDTQSDDKRYFSYRRTTLKKEAKNGVQMAAICLPTT